MMKNITHNMFDGFITLTPSVPSIQIQQRDQHNGINYVFPLLAKQFEQQRSCNPPQLDLILQSLNVNNESLWYNTNYYTNIDGGISI